MVEKKYKTGNENNEYRGELLEHKAEFIGYRLLYSILTKSHTGELIIKQLCGFIIGKHMRGYSDLGS